MTLSVQAERVCLYEEVSMNSNVEVWLWLLLVLLPHNSRTAELLSRYGSALEAAKAMRDGECPLLTEAEKQRVQRTRTREVRSLINECDRLGIRIITFDDAEYPPLLKTIADPPIVLFVKGSLAPLSKMPSVAVVGPRRPSEYGRKVCDTLCTDMAEDGVALISGLAVGIDACVHRCAVNNSGYTVGVLGCGIMVNYPAENEELKEEIVKSGGAVISELLPYASVSASYFKQRNRIISGLAMGTLVPEASSRSGSLLTAAHAAVQGRRLMCIPPHDILSERFSGTAHLIRDGAQAVFGTKDIYSELNNGVQQCEQLDMLRQKAAEKLTAPKKQKSAKKAATLSKKPEEKKTQEHEAPARVLPDIAQLSPQEAEVVLLLKDRPLTMDELIDKTGKRCDEICSIILGLELNDAIVRSRDGMFSLP